MRLMSYRLRMDTPLTANIRALRVRLRLNQEQFAELIGTTQPTVYRWEKGSKPLWDKIEKMAKVAGCSVEQFTNEPLAGARQQPELTGSQLFLPVTLPNAADMAVMFQALLDGPLKETDREALGAELARFLPTALARLVAEKLSADDGDGEQDPAPNGPSRPKGNPGSRAARRA
jgi:transcriptional regulator with XRE-family HTH domain